MKEELERILEAKEQTHEAIIDVAGDAFERTPNGGVVVVDEELRDLWYSLNENYVELSKQEKELREALR